MSGYVIPSILSRFPVMSVSSISDEPVACLLLNSLSVVYVIELSLYVAVLLACTVRIAITVSVCVFVG